MDEQALALTAMKAEFEETSRLTNARIDDVDKKVTQRIQQVDNRVDTIEDKGKFDISLYLKTNWPWILIIFIFLAYLRVDSVILKQLKRIQNIKSSLTSQNISILL